MDIERPTPEPTFSTKILLLVTPAMNQRLVAIAKEYNISRNELMRQLLEYGMDQLAHRMETPTRDDHPQTAPDQIEIDDDPRIDDEPDEWPIEGHSFYVDFQDGTLH